MGRGKWALKTKTETSAGLAYFTPNNNGGQGSKSTGFGVIYIWSGASSATEDLGQFLIFSFFIC